MPDELPSFAELDHLTDREILIIVVEKLRTIDYNQIQFYKHFWAVALLFLGTGLTGLVSICIAVPTILSTAFGN